MIEKYEAYKKSRNHDQANDLLKYIVNQDEIISNKNSNEALGNYHEAPIEFLPTSKYDPFSVNYNSNFSPSWFYNLKYF